MATIKEEPKQIKCYCGHTTYCDCGQIETTPNKTNMTKQTAVEWLRNEIDNELKVIDNLYGKEIIGRKIAFAFVKRILIQAKEMEKEQIINAWIATDNELQRISAEKYYNETYGKAN